MCMIILLPNAKQWLVIHTFDLISQSSQEKGKLSCKQIAHILFSLTNVIIALWCPHAAVHSLTGAFIGVWYPYTAAHRLLDVIIVLSCPFPAGPVWQMSLYINI